MALKKECVWYSNVRAGRVAVHRNVHVPRSAMASKASESYELAQFNQYNTFVNYNIQDEFNMYNIYSLHINIDHN